MNYISNTEVYKTSRKVYILVSLPMYSLPFTEDHEVQREKNFYFSCCNLPRRMWTGIMCKVAGSQNIMEKLKVAIVYLNKIKENIYNYGTSYGTFSIRQVRTDARNQLKL